MKKVANSHGAANKRQRLAFHVNSMMSGTGDGRMKIWGASEIEKNSAALSNGQKKKSFFHFAMENR
jgi:hypothetical protein